MNLSKLSALFFGAPAKTAGKRAVKFQTVVKRVKVMPGHYWKENLVEISNHSSGPIYVTVSVDFTKAGKK